jgi:hypothetical protein
MSRRRDLREMANLVGNSAAHIAILPDSEFALKEATTYTEDAAETASSRTWSEAEADEFLEMAMRRAASEIKARIARYGLPENRLEDFISRAGKYIKAFAANHMERKN